MRLDVHAEHALCCVFLDQRDARGTQAAAARTIIAHGLNVRQAESLVRQLLHNNRRTKAVKASKPTKDADTLSLERRLTERIGVPVAIHHNAKGRGQVTISYPPLDELDGILSRLT